MVSNCGLLLRHSVLLLSHVRLCNPTDCSPQASLSMGFSRQEYWSGCHFPLKGVSSTQGSNLHLMHWQADSLPLVPSGKLWILQSLESSFIPCLLVYLHTGNHVRPSQVALVVKNPPADATDTRDVGRIPTLGGSSRVGNGNLLQYSYLKNSMDSGAWWATVQRVTKSQT